MTSTETILIIINLILTAVSPIILSFSYLLKHISSSECCASKFKFRTPDITKELTKKSPKR